MNYLFLEYPSCSTCRKAKKWLDEHRITYEDRHIVDRHPSAEELKAWIAKSGLPLKNSLTPAVCPIKPCSSKTNCPA